MRCNLTVRHRKYIAAARQTSTATTEASGPNAPPVRMGGPLNEPRNTPEPMSLPESVIPNSEPSVKFHPKCKPIGSHSRCVAA